MDGINLLFLILIYILGGLLLLGIILLFFGLANKNKDQVRQAIKILSIPLGLTLIYFLFQFFSDAFLMKPSTKELIGVYRATQATNLNLNEDDLNNCKLIFNSDTTYIFIASPIDNMKEAGRYELDYEKPYRELSFYSSSGVRSGHLDRHSDGFTIRVDITGEDSRKSLYFNKIE